MDLMKKNGFIILTKIADSNYNIISLQMKTNRLLLIVIALTAIIACKPDSVEVMGVSINKHEISLVKWQSEVLTVTVTPSNASDQSITWESSNPAVASVNDGIVTGISVGEAIIIAKVGNYTDESKVMVLSPTTEISLDKHEISIEKGETVTLTPIVTPSDATDPLVWSSSDETVAVVTNGVVKAVSTGVAEILVASGKHMDICKVSVFVSTLEVSLDRSEVILKSGETTSLIASVYPSDATDFLEWSSSDETVAIVEGGFVTALTYGTTIITVKSGNYSAQCSVKVEMAIPQAIDLGLSVKWASFNLGAGNPEGYGAFFAWGETEIKDIYSFESYKWSDGTGQHFTKYCHAQYRGNWSGLGAPDGKTILDLEDDAANIKLGESWRIPTEAEWLELCNNCIWAWTSMNGVNGYNVTGPNGNSIFLPASGVRVKTDFNYNGYMGFYWSSCLYSGPFAAMMISFASVQVFYDRFANRSDGLSVRPVTE